MHHLFIAFHALIIISICVINSLKKQEHETSEQRKKFHSTSMVHLKSVTTFLNDDMSVKVDDFEGFLEHPTKYWDCPSPVHIR